MLFHYIRIAIRNLAKQKALATINILGLSIGLACFTLFLLYAVHEFSYDRFHKKGDRIFRLYDWWVYEGENPRSGSEPTSCTPLGPAMKQDLPDVEAFVRWKGGGSPLVRTGDQLQKVKLTYADPQVFSVFTFPLLYGNPSTALADPNNLVITKDVALRLFGETNVTGKILPVKTGEQFESFVVTGVAENIPGNSSLQFEMLGSFDRVLNTDEGRASMANWNMTIGINVYVLLRAGSTLPNDPARLAGFRQKYFPDERKVQVEEGLWDGKGKTPNGYGLQPIREIHTGVNVDKWSAVDPKDIWILISIAAGVLLIACINFTTLAIGRSAGRAKEIGVRKVIGSRRKQLIYQFLSESLILTGISAVIGLILCYALLPFFNQLSGSRLQFSFAQYPEMIGWVGGLLLLTALLAGSYPALVLSNFKPIEVLKNKIRLAGSNFFTKSLVTFQFVLSIGLIVCTAIILQQLSFMHHKDLGFTKENVIVVNKGSIDAEKAYPLFRQALRSNPRITGITGTEIGLGAGEGQMGGGYKYGENKSTVLEYPVDPDFINVLDIDLLAGRNFDPAIASDTTSSIIVNEALVQQLLQTTNEDAIGKQIQVGKGSTPPFTIIGVTRNIHYEDLTRTVRPQLFFQPAHFRPGRFYVRTNPGDPTPVLKDIEKTWKSIAPGMPFEYSFLDEKFDRFYEAQQRWSKIVGWAGGISIFLACLGLFGLAALAAINRVKEIGIRKVMGASNTIIVGLLSKSFVKLVLIAFVIATPVAWYFMDNWLKDFAYRINVSWSVFAITGALALLLAVITIGVQALKAAMANPVKSLRTE